MTEPTIVIGGGLTGLVVAWRLKRARRAVRLFEGLDRTGGQIHSFRDGDMIVELGAEGFVARSEALVALSRDLGIEDQLIDQVTTLTYLRQEDGALKALAPGEAATILGFQVPKSELGRGIRSMRDGMGQLTEKLTAELGEAVECGRRVQRVASGTRGPEVILEDERVPAARVVVAVPAKFAGPMLRDVGGEALDRGKRLSNVSVSLLYRRDQIAHALDGSGFILPRSVEQHGFRACSFVSTKFGRPCAPDHTQLRAFFRPTLEEVDQPKAHWVEAATAAVAAPLGIDGLPAEAWVSVWPDALPIFDDTYRALVCDAEAQLAPRGVLLAGSHFHGAGIDAAVRSAENAARQITE
ncbi:MAG: FAD-dependent oxidoreductase [Myxococcota bacterium]